jgi:hypothetical protein
MPSWVTNRDDFDAVVFGALDDAVAAAKVLQAGL